LGRRGEAYTHSYISSPLHHDLALDVSSERAWGNIVYRFQTDRYGFRTSQCAPGESEKSRPAVFVVGKYFIRGDVHFSELGNRLLFDEVRNAVGDY
jgi:hypothetical protein